MRYYHVCETACAGPGISHTPFPYSVLGV